MDTIDVPPPFFHLLRLEQVHVVNFYLKLEGNIYNNEQYLNTIQHEGGLIDARVFK